MVESFGISPASRERLQIALDVAGRLNEREPIPYHVDVLCGNALDNPDLRDQVKRVGKVLYRRKPLEPTIPFAQGSPGSEDRG